MKLGALKGIIGAVAPTLGTALAGPLGGTAANAIASVLGCKNDAKSISTAMQSATPEQLLAIKEAELEFESKMAQMDVDIFALETQDVQHARKAFANDWTPKILAIGLLIMFAGYAFLITISPPSTQSDTIPSLLIGSMSGVLASVVSFYFGSSHKKDD
ncbi:MAG: hypothetical protein CBC57_06675 [Euryarchaeota archaeon TMED97]|nr:MAG: hypothetical protein CBC57_06675 [Euryarchaeota archaeon TMED97]|tara:strand:+ start:207 stop:683 length:477 start_codon:yes stop_codon:yes gene_type:complete